ncbi:MAG: hypothetical protein IJM09_01245, partial [Neisseriaceae bacterium]|nr:hypothetical protein [Neisseriaceae bacterium]
MKLYSAVVSTTLAFSFSIFSSGEEVLFVPEQNNNVVIIEAINDCIVNQYTTPSNLTFISDKDTITYSNEQQVDNLNSLLVREDDIIQVINTNSNLIIGEIDLELDEIKKIDGISPEIIKVFNQTAEQLKVFLNRNIRIKKMPDIITFNKGYFGLSWNTLDDKTIYLYSLPDNKLFYQIIGDNFNHKEIVDSKYQNFQNLID